MTWQKWPNISKTNGREQDTMKTLKDIKNTKTDEAITLADILAAGDIVEGQYLELLHMAEVMELGENNVIFKAYRDAEKATAEAVQTIHALAVAIEKNEKENQPERGQVVNMPACENTADLIANNID